MNYMPFSTDVEECNLEQKNDDSQKIFYFFMRENTLFEEWYNATVNANLFTTKQQRTMK